MRLVLVRADAEVRLDVALDDPDAQQAPAARAGRYAVYYAIRNAAPEDGERLAQKLAEVLKANAGVAPPPGMTVFTPTRPGTTL